ncbi:hypothetical protein [Streptomyces sp. NBC_00091]|nr:hypothetical protein [Streptomyces sp. NBC_00091]MCX5380358.1 hypothetical protein [Streptomyces sp. NBC_00091]
MSLYGRDGSAERAANQVKRHGAVAATLDKLVLRDETRVLVAAINEWP